MLTYGSLFTGIGGIDLGLDRAGWECRWQVESNSHASAILAEHWPRVRRYGDIHAVDPAELELVDLVCGGFPCQPTSKAGRGRGRTDERWLWPEFARILGGVRPRWALLENPPGLLAFSEFGDVLGDLAGLGFDAEWDSFPAAAFGAPHVRDRVFVVAYANRGRRGPERELKQALRPEIPDPSGSRNVADAGSQQLRAETRSLPAAPAARESEGPERERVRPDIGNGGWWEVEPNVGRVVDGVPSRLDRLTRLGNAVVPQVAQFVGTAIMTVHLAVLERTREASA